MIYVYVCDHKESVVDDDDWTNAFVQSGLDRAELEFVTHDSDVWYHRGVSTCVGYGDFEDTCDYHLSVCSSGVIPYTKCGDREEQAREVLLAIRSGGEHPQCPIIYPGTT